MSATVAAGVLSGAAIGLDVIAAAIALVVVLFVVVLIRRRRRKERALPEPLSRSEPTARTEQTFEPLGIAGLSPPPAQETEHAVERDVEHEAAEVVALETAREPPPSVEDIRAAEERQDLPTMARLHLARGKDQFAHGRMSEAADELRSCIRVAARCRDVSIQADARIELAEIALAAGDLTTACEHWQIARRLFHDLDRKPDFAHADTLMRKHGCPTDWVLTDF